MTLRDTLVPAMRHFSHAESIKCCRAILLGMGLILLTGEVDAAEGIPIQFGIPAQPIASAIDLYSAATGFEVFYDGALAVGRRSNMVQGSFLPDAALRELLVGTGLIARATGQGRFTLVPSEPPRVANAVDQPYFAKIQAKVSQALCAHAETQPGDVDLLVRIWISSSGTVQRAQLVGMPDAAARDGAFITALRGLLIAPPPPDMPQPLTMAILARNGDQPTGCTHPVSRAR